MDNLLKTGIAVSGSVVSWAYGGWSALLGALLLFVFVDYLTGILASAYEGKLSSQIGFRGIIKKVMIFVMVAIGHTVDQHILGDGHFFRDATIFFFLANELLSIIENAGRMGVPVPPILKKAIAILKDKGGK